MKIRFFLITVLVYLSLSFNLHAQPGHHRHHGGKHQNVHIHGNKRGHINKKYFRYRPVQYKGVNYFYRGGNYYRQRGNKYVRVMAPVGLRVRHLPPGYRAKIYRGQRYYYTDNSYFRQASPGIYIIINRPW